MFIIRPIRDTDLDNLMEMLSHAGRGLTSLPRDPEVLGRRIKASMKSFAEEEIHKPGGEDYLFTMENIFTGELVGISGIISKIGGFEPFFFYRIKEHQYYSKELNKGKKFITLNREKIHAGPSEICSLFLNPEYRNSQNGRLLSLSRFLYVANDPSRFEKQVIAEMRGRVDESGYSPFYEAVGEKFLHIEFNDADYLSMKTKSFIEDLLPDFPIVVELLPKEAREVVGKVHPHTEPAKHILEKEGFTASGLVGIFEPGPVLKAKFKDVRSVKDSQIGEVQEITDDFEGVDCIVSTLHTSWKFKATVGRIKKLENGKLLINKLAAAALKIKLGTQVRHVNFKP